MSKDMEDEIMVLEQRIKRYDSALDYLEEKALEIIQNDDASLDASLLSYEIVKVSKDTRSYTFDFED